MKIKIKSREEIENTLNESNSHVDGSRSYFSESMFKHCGETFKAVKDEFHGYKLRTNTVLSISGVWYWHPDWYEVVESDLTDEDLMDIELMNEMLGYLISERDLHE